MSKIPYQMHVNALMRPGRRLAFPVMAVLLAFTLGILVGLVIALLISMQTFQADFIYPAAVGWAWA